MDNIIDWDSHALYLYFFSLLKFKVHPSFSLSHYTACNCWAQQLQGEALQCLLFIFLSFLPSPQKILIGFLNGCCPLCIFSWSWNGYFFLLICLFSLLFQVEETMDCCCLNFRLCGLADDFEDSDLLFWLMGIRLMKWGIEIYPDGLLD